MAVRTVLLASAAALALLCVADTACGDTVRFQTTGERTGDGGEFLVDKFDDAFSTPHAGLVGGTGYAGYFTTFCLEKTEGIAFNTDFYYTLGTAAIAGGGGSTNGSDPLSAETAKLFFAFWTDQWDVSDSANFATVVDYDYSTTGSTTRGADGAALQQAIWALEGEMAYADINAQAQDYYDFAQDADLTWALLGRSGWSGIGLVRVINPTYNGVDHQSQMVVVPLPPAALMGFALLAGLGLARVVRRRQSF